MDEMNILENNIKYYIIIDKFYNYINKINKLFTNEIIYSIDKWIIIYINNNKTNDEKINFFYINILSNFKYEYYDMHYWNKLKNYFIYKQCDDFLLLLNKITNIL
jgi:hypothetical protein